MGNFQQHLLGGIGVASACAAVGYFQFDLTKVQSAATFIIATMASLAPDLDHPEGVPGKILAEILGALAPIGFLLYFPAEHTKHFALEHWIVLFFTIHFVAKQVYILVLSRLMVHRGIFHSLPAAIICGECVFLMFWHLSLSQKITMGVIATAGYLTHLVIDEIYGIEWKKMEVKRSLGSALDIGRFGELSTWIAYCILSGLGWVIYQFHIAL